MGMIERFFSVIFGGGRNVVKETAEVFFENAEAGAGRDATLRAQALQQHSSEFAVQRQGGFDRFMDGVNRLPRPALALGTLGLFVAAMVDPIWFASRMQGIALVPEPLWWLLGAIVSFYFGARHQLKSQEFQKSITETMARVPQVVENTRVLKELAAQAPGVASTGPDASLTLEALELENNPALSDWRRKRA
ncbi:holin family protein [Parasulfitobacter algicola]|uniref:Holin family protein n=1 Tax=Parasulfitobacter algicola TaxID=2614809 RepID=A0ABX2IRS0_9RHOB|nr:holin family protein [Sulfitobacter algicola]NSX55592.1 holin family protein [Sulfitobacter algicola]